MSLEGTKITLQRSAMTFEASKVIFQRTKLSFDGPRTRPSPSSDGVEDADWAGWTGCAALYDDCAGALLAPALQRA